MENSANTWGTLDPLSGEIILTSEMLNSKLPPHLKNEFCSKMLSLCSKGTEDSILDLVTCEDYGIKLILIRPSAWESVQPIVDGAINEFSEKNKAYFELEMDMS